MSRLFFGLNEALTCILFLIGYVLSSIWGYICLVPAKFQGLIDQNHSASLKLKHDQGLPLSTHTNTKFKMRAWYQTLCLCVLAFHFIHCKPIETHTEQLLKREPADGQPPPRPKESLLAQCRKAARPEHEGVPPTRKRDDHSGQHDPPGGDGDAPKCDEGGPPDDSHKKKNPPWNLNDITCDRMTFQGPEGQWKAADGSKTLKLYEDYFSTNKLICDQCMGELVSACHSDNPDCKQGLRDLAKTKGSDNARWDTGVAVFAHVTSSLDLICDIGTNPCNRAPECQDCKGPGGFALMKSMAVLHNLMQNQYDAINDAGNNAAKKMTLFQDVFGKSPRDRPSMYAH